MGAEGKVGEDGTTVKKIKREGMRDLSGWGEEDNKEEGEKSEE